MTTIATRTRRIAQLEGFDIMVLLGDTIVSANANGLLGPYPYEKAARGAWTVDDWIEKRFRYQFPNFNCEVMTEDGSIADKRMTLDEVRATYFD